MIKRNVFRSSRASVHVTCSGSYRSRSTYWEALIFLSDLRKTPHYEYLRGLWEQQTTIRVTRIFYQIFSEQGQITLSPHCQTWMFFCSQRAHKTWQIWRLFDRFVTTESMKHSFQTGSSSNSCRDILVNLEKISRRLHHFSLHDFHKHVNTIFFSNFMVMSFLYSIRDN